MKLVQTLVGPDCNKKACPKLYFFEQAVMYQTSECLFQQALDPLAIVANDVDGKDTTNIAIGIKLDGA